MPLSEHLGFLKIPHVQMNWTHRASTFWGLYLTPDGVVPSHPAFIPVDYGQIASLVEELTGDRQLSANPDVRTLLSHYAQMLRRHIVSESEIAQLCQKIYRKHRQALDLIYDHRPDSLAARGEFLKSLIAVSPELVIVNYSPHQWVPSVQVLAFTTGRKSDGRGSLPVELGRMSQAVKVTIRPSFGNTCRFCPPNPRPIQTYSVESDSLDNHHLKPYLNCGSSVWK